MKGYIYILQCSDNSFYTGSTNNLEIRLAQHQNGEGANYTKKRLPVKLVFSQEYERVDEAFYVEKQVQGWSRKKKQALINGDFDRLPELAQCQNESHSRNATLPFDSYFDSAQHRSQGAVTDDVAITDTDDHKKPQTSTLNEIQSKYPERSTEEFPERSRRARRAKHKPKQQGKPMKENWETVDLGSVCDLIGGGTPSKSKKEYYSGHIPWATVRDMRVENLEETELSITKQAVSDSSTKIIPKNNVIIATRVGLGKVCILKNDTAINQDLKGVIPKTDNIIPDYVFWWFKNISDEIINAGTGLTVQGVKLPFVKELQIPFITATEQKQIVTLLDQAFKVIDQAQANIETNITNSEALIESYLQKCFSNNLSGSVFKPLNDICELIVDCEHKTAPTQETGYPSIRTPNIGKGELILNNVNRVSKKVYKEWTKRAIPQSGDLILAREAPAGNIAVIPENISVCLGQRTVLIRPKEDIFIPKYLAYLVLSRDVQKSLLSHSQGVTVGHINMRDIRAFKIYNLPSLEKQKNIVSKINSILYEINKVISIYKRQLSNTEELKKSILQKAFNGELT